MKRLNPLYLIFLCLIVLLVSFVQLSSAKNSYNSKVEEYNNLEIVKKEYQVLKNSWNNEAYVNKTLDAILKSSLYSSQKVLRVKANNVIKVKMESKNPKVLNSFLSRVLNKQLALRKLLLEKDFLSFEVGIK